MGGLGKLEWSSKRIGIHDGLLCLLVWLFLSMSANFVECFLMVEKHPERFLDCPYIAFFVAVPDQKYRHDSLHKSKTAIGKRLEDERISSTKMAS